MGLVRSWLGMCTLVDSIFFFFVTVLNMSTNDHEIPVGTDFGFTHKF